MSGPAGYVRERNGGRSQQAGSHEARATEGSRPRSQVVPVLYGVVGLLCVLGLIMVLSSSSVEALRRHGGPWTIFLRQAAWLVLGTAGMWVASHTDYHLWRRLARPLLLVTLVLLVLVLVPGVGITAGGSTRWLGYGPFRFQPSELAKLALLVLAAELLARRAERSTDMSPVLRPVILVLGVLVALVLLEPDMGTAMILVVVALVLLFIGGLPLPRMGGLLAMSGVFAVVVALLESYRRVRLLSFLDPWDDPANTGYQVAQSLVALGTGGVTGVGLGASRAKWGFLPNAHTDFIFAIIGEEMGLLGTLAVVVLFATFAVMGVRAAIRAPDRFGLLLAAGVTVWVMAQALINIGAVIGLLPVTGVPLPFVSFGGSALVVTMIAAGMLVNVARQAGTPKGGDGTGTGRTNHPSSTAFGHAASNAVAFRHLGGPSSGHARR